MPGTIGQFQIMRTLGSGASCKVKLGVDSQTGKKVAVKIMHDNMSEQDKKLVMTEVEALRGLKHQNIIELLECGQGEYVKTSGKKRIVSYIVLELALGGELFDYIAISGRFEEPLARYYFKQFMAGLDNCHQNGFAHRDLKPENLLLDQQFTLKIADFGFAAPVEGRDGGGYLTSKLGTLNYMAPEIHLKQDYNGKSIDLFAAAIILFIMVAQHPPFTTAQPNDPFYRCLAANRADIFWRTHCKNKVGKEEYFSEEFKDLIQCMLQLESSHRPSLAEILAHPWMQGDVPSEQQVKQEFEKRDFMVKAQMEADKQQKEAEKKQRVATKTQTIRNTMRSNKQVMRGDQDDEKEITDDELLKPVKHLDQYEKLFAQKTEFFSSYSPDMIEEALLKHLREKEKIEPVVNDKKYKIKFILKTGDQGDQFQETEICVRILSAGTKTVCVEFQKIKGNNTRFHEHFKDFNENVLSFSNDVIV